MPKPQIKTLVGFRRRPRRGMALYLVMVALVVCVLLGTVFLANSSTANVVGRNVEDRLRARSIAEAGIDMALRYIDLNSDWRTRQPNGAWVSNFSMLGGSVTISGEDGSSIDSTGQVVGDGSLSDGDNDPVTFTAVGVYGDARYRARIIVTPGVSQSLAVQQSIILKKNTVIDSYSAAKGIYGTGNQTSYARLTANTISTQNIVLAKNSKITGTVYLPKGGNSAKAVTLTGSATITGGTSNAAVEGWDIAEIVSPAYTPSASDVAYTSTSITTLNSDTACNNLTLKDSATLKIVGNVNLFVDGDLNIQNNARIRLDNPKYGNTTAYGLTKTNVANKQYAVPVVVTTAIDARSIGAYVKKSGKKIRMAIYADSGGVPGALIVQSPVDTMGSDSMYWHEVDIAGTSLAIGTYWVSLSFDDNGAGYGYQVGGLTRIRNNPAVSNGFLAAWGASDSTAVENMNVYITGNIAGQGATLNIYTKGKCIVGDTAQVNANTGQGSRLTFNHLDTNVAAQVELLGSGSVVYGTINAPDAVLFVHDQAKLYGLIRARDLKMQSNPVINVDTSGGTTSPGMLIDQSINMDDSSLIQGIAGSAIIGCNSAGAPVISLRDYTVVNGDAFGGPGGVGADDVKVATHAQLTGVADNLRTAVDLSSPSVPSVTPILGDVKYTSGSGVINSSFTCDNLSFNDNSSTTVNGNVNIVIKAGKDFNAIGTARLIFAPNSKLTVFCSHAVHMQDNVQLNMDGDPSKFIINYAGTNKIAMTQYAVVCAILRAPLCEVRAQDNVKFSGSISALRFTNDDHAKIHLDSVHNGGITWIEGK